MNVIVCIIIYVEASGPLAQGLGQLIDLNFVIAAL
jgi:hypothetical protein